MTQQQEKEDVRFKMDVKELYPLLRKIPKQEMENLLTQYEVYLSKQRLVPFILLGFVFIACIHNGLIFLDVYTADFNVQEVMIGLLLIFLLPCFMIIGILLIGQFSLRGVLKKVCIDQQIPLRATRREFNQFIKSTMGGNGI